MTIFGEALADIESAFSNEGIANPTNALKGFLSGTTFKRRPKDGNTPTLNHSYCPGSTFCRVPSNANASPYGGKVRFFNQAFDPSRSRDAIKGTAIHEIGHVIDAKSGWGPTNGFASVQGNAGSCGFFCSGTNSAKDGNLKENWANGFQDWVQGNPLTTNEAQFTGNTISNKP
jgi:hypothetical protein